MTQKSFSDGALPLSDHAKADFDLLYSAHFYDRIPKQGVFMDIGTGIARDAVEIHNRRNGRLLVVGIEPDESAYEQACAQYPDKDIVLCRDWDDVSGIKRNRQIAYLVGEVQNLPEPPPKLKADFVNCSAVVMFVPENERMDFLRGLHDLSKPYTDIFLRWRTEQLKGQMVHIDERRLVNELLRSDFFVDIKPGFWDGPPHYRDFQWHDTIITPTAPAPKGTS